MEEKASLISYFILTIGLVVIGLGLLLLGTIIYSRRKQNYFISDQRRLKQNFETQLLRSQIEVQEQTFQQIGKELHDNVGQLLSTSRMLIGLTERSLENPPDTLLTANATLGQAINELRSLSKSLDKEWLEQFSFSENLYTEIARINAGNKIRAIYSQSEKILLKPNEQIILFRIVQEAVQNAIKHANPTEIVIGVEKKNENLQICITDNGSGFAETGKGVGMGLVNMKHRTALLSGTIKWEAQPGQGTTVIIKLPFKEDFI